MFFFNFKNCPFYFFSLGHLKLSRIKTFYFFLNTGQGFLLIVSDIRSRLSLNFYRCTASKQSTDIAMNFFISFYYSLIRYNLLKIRFLNWFLAFLNLLGHRHNRWNLNFIVRITECTYFWVLRTYFRKSFSGNNLLVIGLFHDLRIFLSYLFECYKNSRNFFVIFAKNTIVSVVLWVFKKCDPLFVFLVKKTKVSLLVERNWPIKTISIHHDNSYDIVFKNFHIY